MNSIKKLSEKLDTDRFVSPDEINSAVTRCIDGDSFAVSNCFDPRNLNTAINGCQYTADLLLRGSIQAKYGMITNNILAKAKHALTLTNMKTTISLSSDDTSSYTFYKLAQVAYIDEFILFEAQQKFRGLTVSEFNMIEQNLLRIALTLNRRRFRSGQIGVKRFK